MAPLGRDEVGRASDEALLGGYRDTGRPEQLAELYRRYAGELERYLVRYLGDPVLAEDALQDTFLRVQAKCGLYRDGWPARPWLYAVAVHRAVDAVRRARRHAAIGLDQQVADVGSDEPGTLVEWLTSAEPGPLEQLEVRERQSWVRATVAELPEPSREVLVLAHYQGLSYAEIAARLGIPLGTVKSRLHDALARLRAKAERYDRGVVDPTPRRLSPHASRAACTLPAADGAA